MALGWDTQPVLGPDEVVKEAFLEVFCDLLWSAWLDGAREWRGRASGGAGEGGSMGSGGSFFVVFEHRGMNAVSQSRTLLHV